MDIYIVRVFLKNELAVLDIPELVAGIITTIIAFAAIAGYTENRKRLKEIRTDYENKHEKLSQALKKNEALALLGQMTAALAHELQTPIATLSNLVQSLPSRQLDLHFVERFTALANGELQRTQRLINNLLIYGKDIAVKNDEWIEFRPFVKKLSIKNMISLASYNEALPEISLLIDKFYADLMFDNILRNSKQSGATEISIKVENEVLPEAPNNERDSFVSIYFEDNGQGFPEQTSLEELTAPFVTGRAKGAGLGLFMVEKIITAYQGKLILYRLPKGAGIELVLPKRRFK
jgi:signal transduction histidine kinase